VWGKNWHPEEKTHNMTQGSAYTNLSEHFFNFLFVETMEFNFFTVMQLHKFLAYISILHLKGLPSKPISSLSGQGRGWIASIPADQVHSVLPRNDNSLTMKVILTNTVIHRAE
jgi:hypothetical protein